MLLIFRLADLMSQKAALENELIQLEGASAEQLAVCAYAFLCCRFFPCYMINSIGRKEF